MIIIIATLFLIFMIAIIAREIIYIRKSEDLRIISAVRLMFALIYGLVPAIILLEYYGKGVESYGIDYSGKGLFKLFILLIFGIIFYAMMDLGYRASISRLPHLSLGLSRKLNKCENDSKMFVLIVVLTIISVISLFLWTQAYGGAQVMMTHASALRSGFTSIDNGFAFFKRFANVSTISSYIAFSYALDKSKKPQIRFINLVCLCVSIYVKIMYSLIDDGRLGAGIFVIGFPAIILYKKLIDKKITIRKIGIVGMALIIVAYLFMVFSNPVMNSIRTGEMNLTIDDFNITTSIREELGYTIESAQKAIELRYEGFEYTFFKNVSSGVFAYLPRGITPAYAKTTLTQINSINLYGSNVHYGSPPDLISACIYDLGYLGVIVYALLLGIIVRKFDTFFKTYKTQSKWGLIVYLCLLFRISRVVANASFYNVALSVFYLVIAALILWVIHHIKGKDLK